METAHSYQRFLHKHRPLLITQGEISDEEALLVLESQLKLLQEAGSSLHNIINHLSCPALVHRMRCNLIEDNEN